MEYKKYNKLMNKTTRNRLTDIKNKLVDSSSTYASNPIIFCIIIIVIISIFIIIIVFMHISGKDPIERG